MSITPRINSTIVLNITHPRDPLLLKKSEWFSQQPGVTLLSPPKKTLGKEIKEELIPTLHITRKGTFLETGKARLSFHPNMALLRVIQLLRGGGDRFLQAVGVQEGDSLIDATLGLGTDALVAAFQVGKRGQVIGIEHSPILAALVQNGLRELALENYPRVENPHKAQAWQALAEAARRIEVHCGDHQKVLAQYATSSVDVIFFDPMFRHTRSESASIRPLHEVSNPNPLAKEAVEEACRVVRQRVILKERKGSSEFRRLGFSIQEGGKYSHLDYGIILKEGAGS